MRQWDAGVGCGLAIIFNQTLANAQSRFVKGSGSDSLETPIAMISGD